MSGRVIRLRAVCAAAFVLVFISSRAVFSSAASGKLPVLGRVPPFLLRASNGKLFKESRLKGKVWIADFIYTRCTDQCPLMSARMAQLQSRFKADPSVVLVSFTLDPAHDSPPVLKAYARRCGALENRWFFLTGSQAALWTLARKTFRLPVGTPGKNRAVIVHSNMMILVDGRGRVRGYYDSSRPEIRKMLVKDAGSLL